MVYLSRLLPCQIRSEIPDRIQGRHRLCLGLDRSDTRLSLVVDATTRRRRDDF